MEMSGIKSLEAAYSRKALSANAKKMVEAYLPTDSAEKISHRFFDFFSDYSTLYCQTAQLHSLVNGMMMRFYHNEAFVKSSFINKVLWRGQHVNVFELPVKGSRIDLCKINGESIAYEIKTDYDTLKRLPKQLADYSCVFEYVYVVCSERRSANVEKKLPAHVGIYAYRDSGSNVTYRKAKEAVRSSTLSPKDQLDCLTLGELRSFFRENGSRKALYEAILSSQSPEAINLLFKEAVKAHYAKNWSFLKENAGSLNAIDYQWSYRTMALPDGGPHATI
jgi:hypothetical protein